MNNTGFRVAGIDPGMNGGIAIICDRHVYTAIPMPILGKGLDTKTIREIMSHVDFVMMERVSAMPKQGVVSMFNFGVGYGMLQGIIETLGIPLRFVTPQAWKKEILAGTAKDKLAAIDYVKRVYPYVNLVPEGHRKPHDGVADSIIIAEYGYRAFS